MKKMIIQNKQAIIIGFIALSLLALLLITRPNNRQTPQSQVIMNKHTQQIVQFFTKVIGSQARTKVYIPFAFENDQFSLMLAYKRKDTTMKEFVVYHPQISQLNWSIVKEGEITLLQRNKTYNSITEFIENPPKNILADEITKELYPKLNVTTIPTKQFSPGELEKYDYIFSSIVPIKAGNATLYYENLINTSDALLDDTNQITWVIRAQDADENHIFYLGNIDITYLQ